MKMEISTHSLLFITLLFLPPFFLILISKKLKSGSGIKLPPKAPYTWPIFGNLFSFDRKKPQIALSNLAKYLGPVFSLRFGSMFVVVVSSPEAARQVFKIHDKELSGRYVLQVCKKAPALTTSVIAWTKEWDEQLRVLRGKNHIALFSSQAMESQSKMRKNKVREMLQHLNTKKGEVVKIADIILATMVNSLSMAMTSQDLIRNLDNIQDTKSYMRKILLFGMPGIADLFPALTRIDFRINQSVNDYIDVITCLWGDIVAEGRRRGQEQGQGQDDSTKRSPDFLDSLIKNSCDDLHIFNILTEFFESSDTITTVTEWVLAELTRCPEAMVMLREELDDAIGEGNVLREHDIEKLPFLQACIKETFRLHPPAPLLVPRVAIEACKLMDYDIPKGSLVITNAYALGRDPKIWEDSNSFKPERFLGKNLDVKGTNYELLPFGSGRRMCAGYPYALKQIPLLVASIVSAFDWSVAGVMEMGEKFSVNLQKEKPLLLMLNNRRDLMIE